MTTTETPETVGPLSRETDVIGIVGVGDMGEGIANSLLRNGWKLLAYVRRAAAADGIVAQGARVAPTIQDLARGSSMVLVVVTDDEQVGVVMREMLPATKPGTIFLVCSTVLPSLITELAAEAHVVGADIVDAGVAGGREKADLGTLTVMIGGSDESVARCKPVIDDFAENPFHLGPAGAGVAGKLVNNVMTGGGYALALEAFQLGVAYGIDEDTLTEVVTLSGGDTRVIRTWGRQDRIRRGWPEMERTALYEFLTKDLRNAAVAGGERHLVLPIISTAGSVLPRMYAKRDAMLATREIADIPKCTVCNQELAVTYRARGVHPECIFF